MKKPLLLVVLPIALAWLSIGGLMFGPMMLFGDRDTLPPVIDMPRYHGLFGLLYGLTALTASIGLWKMRRWGLAAFDAWCLSCAGLWLGMLVSMSDIALGGVPGILAFGAVAAALLWWVRRRIATHLRRLA